MIYRQCNCRFSDKSQKYETAEAFWVSLYRVSPYDLHISILNEIQEPIKTKTICKLDIMPFIAERLRFFVVTKVWGHWWPLFEAVEAMRQVFILNGCRFVKNLETFLTFFWCKKLKIANTVLINWDLHIWLFFLIFRGHGGLLRPGQSHIDKFNPHWGYRYMISKILREVYWSGKRL